MKPLVLSLMGGMGLASMALACSRSDKNELAAEVAEREKFARKTLIDDDAGATLYATSTSEIQFGQGFGFLSSDPPDEFRSKPFRWMGQNAHIRLKSHGRRPMRIVIAGWVHQKMVQTHPSMDVYIDNYFVGASGQFDNDHYWYEVVAPEWVFQRDWVDLEIRISAVGFHWDAPPELKTIVLYRFEYTEAP